MTMLRRFAIALLTVSMLMVGAASAASTTNFSDQWWVPGESGWGASVLQQAGHVGQIASTLNAGGLTGSVTFFEIEFTISGITGRFVGSVRGTGGGCNLANGRIAGVRR